MSRTTTLADEELRLAALASLAILDTPAEERFDRITRFAQQVLGMPIALMALVARDEVRFKSAQGTALDSLPRAGSFCSVAIGVDGVLVVEDADADPRFRETESVRGEAGLKFYAGHSLTTQGGQRIGTLCVLDHRARQFNDAQHAQLADLAHLIEGELHKVQVASVQGELLTAQEQLRRFFSLSLDMLCIAGTDGYFKQLNPSWEMTLGWTREELMARPYLDFVHPGDRERTVSEARLLAKGNITVAFENRYRCKDGSYRNLTWSVGPDVPSGLLYAVARDVTTLSLAEDELRRSRALAEAASQSKSRFLANMSHEFRTPLNSVLGFTSVMLEEAAGLSVRHRGFLERIQSNGRDLLFLINDILDLAKIEAGHTELELEQVNLADLVATVVSRIEPQATQKGLELRSEAPERLVPLNSDPRRLKQVLVNIVGNAVKFTESGYVTVRVIADATSGRPDRIEIEDTGIGISYEQQDRIFVAFHQGTTSLARRYAGTGLGLTISRSLCEAMGYRLQLWSRSGVGTMFTVYLTPPANEAV